MRPFASYIIGEQPLVISALGPVVFEAKKCNAFIAWASGESVPAETKVDVLFGCYLLWSAAAASYHRPPESFASDSLVRRATDAFASEFGSLPGGKNPWGVLTHGIINTEYDLTLRAADTLWVFEFKVVHGKELRRLPPDEEWQLRRQILAGLLLRKLDPTIKHINHIYVSNYGGPAIELDMELPTTTGRHFVSVTQRAELEANGNPTLATINSTFGGNALYRVRHLSWFQIADFIELQADDGHLSAALRANPCLLRGRSSLDV